MKKKTIALFLALALVVGCAIGGTVAWLTATTDPVVNTFTTAGIDIELKETKQSDGTALGKSAWSAKLVPGASYTKDPTVSVKDTTDVDIWLFVEFKESNVTYLTYTSTLTSANGWTQGDGTNIPADVWYREVETTDTPKSWNLLADLTENGQSTGKQVAVKHTLTKEIVEADGFAAPSLTYTAYAIQKDSFATAALAWAELNPTT